MRRTLLLFIVCVCGAFAFAVGGVWLLDVRRADAGTTILTVNITDDDGDADAGDGECEVGGGGCTLRAAIQEANALGGATINFNISGTGVHTIGGMTTALPIVVDLVIIDGTTEGDYAGTPLIVLNGDGLGSGSGLNVGGLGAGSTIRGLAIINFPSHGINVDSGSVTIESNYIGVAADGSTGAGNGGSGVRLNGGSNLVGGTTAAARNVISDNTGDGVLMVFGASTVRGNYIGTTADGTGALGNAGRGVVASSTGNTIGGTVAGAGNVISGNTPGGVRITGSSNVVQGNLIGTNAAGTLAVPNGNGVEIEGGVTSTIGGATAAARNVISGNGGEGVEISGGASVNTVSGNYIGTNAAGTGTIANTFYGVFISESPSNIIGGLATTPGAPSGNVISGNGSHGVYIAGDASDGNSVLGNVIGLNASGASDLGNVNSGVFISLGDDNVVGTFLSGTRNVISGNDDSGVTMSSAGTTGNVVQNNYIGTDVGGTLDRGNTDHGVLLTTGASGNTVGGSSSGTRNVISGNDANGVRIADGSGNMLGANYIGTDAAGTADLGNTADGVVITSASTNNVIGGTEAGARNVISGNGLSGVGIGGTGTSGNQVIGNYIGTDSTGTVDRGNTDYGVAIDSAAGNFIGGTIPGARNVISGNDIAGIGIGAATGSVAGTIVSGNYVGTNAAGTSGVGNTFSGVGVAFGATDVTIGGSAAGAGNLIAFNGLGGVDLGPAAFGANVSDITVRGNSIHSNTGLGIDIEGDGAVEVNDNLDPDSEDNGQQNFPVITSAQTGSAIIRGTLNSTASSIFVLDFYASPSCDGSGNGEGQTYLGASAVVTDGSGNAAFEVAFDAPLTADQAVTATATDTAGSTSEFSACFTATALTLTTLIGTGSPTPDCGPGPTAAASCAISLPRGLHEVFGPSGVTAGEGQAASGLAPALYFAEGAPNNKVKKLEPPAADFGFASDVAGGGSMYCNICDRLTTSLDGPRDVFVYGKGVFIADTNNCIVRRVDLTDNKITTVAGQNDVCSTSSTAQNGDTGDATSATLNQPRGVAVDAAGNLYIADTLNHRIRKVAADGDGMVDGDAGETITTIAGTGTPSASPTAGNGDTGDALAATFNAPHDVYFLVEDLIVADTNNNKIRRIDYPAGIITTIAGSGLDTPFTSQMEGGLATLANLNRPEAVTAANNKVVIADTKNHAVRMVDLIGRLGDPATPPAFPSVLPGTITTIATGTALNLPAGVFIVTAPASADGALRVSNTDANRIVSAGIDPTGTHTTNIRPSVSCGNVPGVSGVDWLLPVMMLGAIAGRRRIGTLFSRLYAFATRRASSPAAA